jgi:hypothetical protein
MPIYHNDQIKIENFFDMRNKSLDQQSILQEYNKFKLQYKESVGSSVDVDTVLQSKNIETKNISPISPPKFQNDKFVV